MWNVLAWTMLPFPSVSDFLLQKDIPVFCRTFYFPPGEGDYYGLNQPNGVTACDGRRLEFQVLRHIPEIAVASDNREQN